MQINKLISFLALVLSSGLLESVIMGSSIPTREEQANLLINVQEVFEQIKLLVKDEGNSTDESVANDINRMVKRAQEKLLLIEELTLIKLSYTSNSVCMLDSKPIIQNIVREGYKVLEDCIKRGLEDVTFSSSQLTNVTVSATERGQNLLDALSECSRKNGLQVISCYRNIIAKDVVPVKLTLLGAIDAHRMAHLRAIDIRNEANDCIDFTTEKYQLQIDQVLNNAAKCP